MSMEVAAATVALIIIIVGAVMILIEAMNPGAFFIIPGTVLVIVGAIGYAVPDFLFSIYSPIVAVVLALPVTLITIKLYQVLAKPVPPTTTVTLRSACDSFCTVTSTCTLALSVFTSGVVTNTPFSEMCSAGIVSNHT